MSKRFDFIYFQKTGDLCAAPVLLSSMTKINNNSYLNQINQF